jgi:hypothetical protein
MSGLLASQKSLSPSLIIVLLLVANAGHGMSARGLLASPHIPPQPPRPPRSPPPPLIERELPCLAPSLLPGDVHVVFAGFRGAAADHACLLQTLGGLGLTNADFFVYRRIAPSKPLRTYNLRCGVTVHERLLLSDTGREARPYFAYITVSSSCSLLMCQQSCLVMCLQADLAPASAQAFVTFTSFLPQEFYDKLPRLGITFIHGHTHSWHMTCSVLFSRTRLW